MNNKLKDEDREIMEDAGWMMETEYNFSLGGQAFLLMSKKIPVENFLLKFVVWLC
ncbi:hypothetical protein [Pedobacter mendelii]|uniref:Uncharacterized protein n=1 Tax=Pedobacter mendelii TaxID=1908240 RepID=A0ABQ2BIG8_9SPHI|nr:hypothetical protein [Pedobacter mendelii]GGI27007.1 hypothetical protein GCM10008119_25500 [Pedobacter mendelii]